MTLHRAPQATTAQTAQAVEKMLNGMGHGEAVAFARILAAEGMHYTREHEAVELAKFFSARADVLARDVVRSAVAKSLRGESIEAETAAWEALTAISKDRSPADQARYDRDFRGRFAMDDEALRRGGNVNAGTRAHPFSPNTYRENVAAPFTSQWTKPGEQPGDSAFRRLNAGAELMQRTFGPALPPQAMLAAEAGRYVGQIGPYAAQVVVPTADKTAMRYRGIERHEFDPELEAALEANAKSVPENPGPANAEIDAREAHRKRIAANQSRFERQARETQARVGRPASRKPMPVPPYVDVDNAELTPEQRKAANESNQRRENVLRENRARAAEQPLTPQQARRVHLQNRAAMLAANAEAESQLRIDLGLHVHAAAAAEKLKAMGRRRRRLVHGTTNRETGKWEPGEVLRYWKSQLPDADLSTLQLASGTLPPSHGMVMDAKGRVTSQAVGFGEDWYVPFPLNKLSALKGGEYVRTRTFGGPTTEDVYTGLVHGARAVTVVSHSGTFTIEFDDSLTGGRRFNDKALRMTNRYAQLLDAVRSGQIKVGSLDPAMDLELREQADAIASPITDSAANKTELNRLYQDLHNRPRLSRALEGELAQARLNEMVADKYGRHVQAERYRGSGQDTTIGQAVQAELARQVSTNLKEYQLSASRAGATLTPAEQEDFVKSNRDRLQQGLVGADAGDTARRTAAFLGMGPALDSYLHAQAIEKVRGSEALTLNGRGYETAMKALKEQFPYYVKNVQWHPWPPVEGRPGEKDKGYVKPRHNRPAAGKLGLYGHDERVSGEGGKVAADSVRYQESKARQLQREPEAQQGTATPGVRAADGPPPPERVLRMRRQANADMFDWMRGQRTFGPEATDPNPNLTRPIKDALVPTDPAQIAEMPVDLAAVFGADPSAFKAKLLAGDADAEGVLRRAHQFAKDHKTFAGLDGEVAARYERAGGNAAAPGASKDWHDFLNENKAHWSGAAFTGQASPDVIAQVYGSRPELSKLIADGALPAGPDWGFPEEAQWSMLKSGVLARDAQMNKYAEDPVNNEMVRSADREMAKTAEALGMARALANSYRDSVARAAAEQARQAANEPAYQVIMMTNEQAVEGMRQAQAGQTPNRGIGQ